jgi:hypothetical protein
MILRPLRTLLVGIATLSGVAAHAADAARVAILPVVIHSLEESSYLRAGILEMLTSRLGQQAGVSAVRVDDPSAATADLATARAAGRAAGAEWVLFGSFTRFGEGASLDLRCVPVNSDAELTQRSVFVHAGALSDLIPRLDGVVERIGAYVRGGVANATAPVPTPVDVAGELEALKARVRALEARSAVQASSVTGSANSSN